MAPAAATPATVVAWIRAMTGIDPSGETVREGQGALAYLSPGAIRAIARWRKLGQIDRGPLFRRVETHFDGSVRSLGEGPLHANAISLIYRRLIRVAFERGLLGHVGETQLQRWLREVSSHSIRVGVAQDNFAAAESLPAIMQAYRWRDPKTVMRYGALMRPFAVTATCSVMVS